MHITYEFKGNVLIIIVDCLGTWVFVSSVVMLLFSYPACDYFFVLCFYFKIFSKDDLFALYDDLLLLNCNFYQNF